ncbi:MAG: zinc-binding dehydrogenase [Elusimicrobia bacterium]|nr:zinc-binding dehydrogenase [Elusimicrobiota bacterium]
MKRVVVKKPGGHRALELVSEREPVVGAGQVRVRVRAAGVNYADCIVRMGHYEAAKGRYPLTPGFEFSGEVDGVTPGSGFKNGDRVVGITRFGGYASSVVVDPIQLWHAPEGWSFEQAAAFPAVHLTAWYALHRAARVYDGETVLVHSAAGGAGSALVQVAKAAKCRVVAVVGSAEKVHVPRALGADAVVVRDRAGSFWKAVDEAAPQGFDAVFDANGITTLRPGFDRLAPGGRLVVYGFAEMLTRGRDRAGWMGLAFGYARVPRFNPFELTRLNRSVSGFNVVYLFNKPELASQAMGEMLALVGQAKLRPPTTTAFPVEKVAEAHKALESGATTGKLVLTFD